MATPAPRAPRAFPSSPSQTAERKTRPGKKPGPEMEPRGAGIRRMGLELRPRLCPPRALDPSQRGRRVPGGPGGRGCRPPRAESGLRPQQRHGDGERVFPGPDLSGF